MELVYPGQLPKIPSLIHYSLQRRIQGRGGGRGGGGGGGGGGPPPPPSFLDQTEAGRAEKKTAPHPRISGSG